MLNAAVAMKSNVISKKNFGPGGRIEGFFTSS
jgi:hypothetical protein